MSPPVNPGPSFAGFTGDQVTTSVEVAAPQTLAKNDPVSLGRTDPLG